MSTIQQDLILSQLPYPKYYNGYSWNTIINKSRKNIPQYLHQDLPKLKFAPIRQEFKKINQIQCPRLAYFNDKIVKQRMKSHCHGKGGESPQVKNEQKSSKKKRSKLINIKSELQYALLTSDRDSNVIKNLLAKAQTIEQLSAKQKKRTHSVKISPKRQSCFDNTLALVIKCRREGMNKSAVQQNCSSEIIKKVESIPMLPFNND